MAAFVVRGPALVLLAHHHLPLRTEHDALERIREIGFHDRVVAPAGGEQRRLVYEVREVGADHSRRRRRDAPQVDVRRERHRPRVHLEDLLAPRAVGWLNCDATVEAARTEQGGVEHVRPVRRRDHDHARG